MNPSVKKSKSTARYDFTISIVPKDASIGFVPLKVFYPYALFMRKVLNRITNIIAPI